MKYTFDNTPFIYNVYRNGNIWIKGFNCFSKAVSYCSRCAERSDTLIELYYFFGGYNRLIKSWN